MGQFIEIERVSWDRENYIFSQKWLRSASYPDVSLFMKMCAQRKAGKSLVSRSPLPCEKRSAWGGGWTISIFCRIGKGHFSHFSSHFFISLVLFLDGSNSPASSESTPCSHPELVHQTILGDLFFNDLICDLKLKLSPQISDGKIWGNKMNRPTR